MNLKLKSFIVIVDLVACWLEKMLSDKIKIQIIFFLKRRYQIFAPTQFTLHVIVWSLYTNFACNKHGENLNKSEENPTGHLRQIQPFKTLTYDIVIIAFI